MQTLARVFLPPGVKGLFAFRRHPVALLLIMTSAAAS
jgi:hypothetical protein